ncbi:MAG: hypothetical protein ACXAD7_00410 [Candidatus Kariarchaeaceae archaeon]
MALSNVLGLDHFILSFATPEFEKLKPLTDIFHGINHRIIETPEHKYEGIYIMLADGNYIELLHQKFAVEEHKVQMSVVLCSYTPQEADVDLLPTLYPNLNWESDEALKPGGEKWYKSFSLQNNNMEFMTWGMKYYDLQANKVLSNRTNPPETQHSFSELISTNILLPSVLTDTVIYMTTWFPEKVDQPRHDQLYLSIPNASNHNFQLTLSCEDTARIIPKEIVLRMNTPFYRKSSDIDGIETISEEKIVKIDFDTLINESFMV